MGGLLVGSGKINLFQIKVLWEGISEQANNVCRMMKAKKKKKSLMVYLGEVYTALLCFLLSFLSFQHSQRKQILFMCENRKTRK